MIAITTNSSMSVNAERRCLMGETSDTRGEEEEKASENDERTSPPNSRAVGLARRAPGSGHPELRNLQAEVGLERIEDHQEADPRGVELGGMLIHQHISRPHLQPSTSCRPASLRSRRCTRTSPCPGTAGRPSGCRSRPGPAPPRLARYRTRTTESRCSRKNPVAHGWCDRIWYIQVPPWYGSGQCSGTTTGPAGRDLAGADRPPVGQRPGQVPGVLVRRLRQRPLAAAACPGRSAARRRRRPRVGRPPGRRRSPAPDGRRPRSPGWRGRGSSPPRSSPVRVATVVASTRALAGGRTSAVACPRRNSSRRPVAATVRAESPVSATAVPSG